MLSLTRGGENHRLVLVKLLPAPFVRFHRKTYSIDHIAFTFTSIKRLLVTYGRLKKVDITPVWSIHQGPTICLYDEDSEGIRLELQPEALRAAKLTASYLDGGWSRHRAGNARFGLRRCRPGLWRGCVR